MVYPSHLCTPNLICTFFRNILTPAQVKPACSDPSFPHPVMVLSLAQFPRSCALSFGCSLGRPSHKYDSDHLVVEATTAFKPCNFKSSGKNFHRERKNNHFPFMEKLTTI